MFGGPRLASYRQRLSGDDFLVDRSLRDDYQNCSVLYYVLQLHPFISPLMNGSN